MGLPPAGLGIWVGCSVTGAAGNVGINMLALGPWNVISGRGACVHTALALQPGEGLESLVSQSCPE